MAGIQDWNTLIVACTGVVSASIGAAGAIMGQSVLAGHQRKLRLFEEEGKREQARDDFQKNTLMKIQVLSARLVSQTVDLMSARLKKPTTEEFLDPKKFSEVTEGLNERALSDFRRLALLRERVQDDQLREKLQELNRRVGKYIAKRVPRNEIEAAMQDMDTAYHDANDHLGPILRKL